MSKPFLSSPVTILMFDRTINNYREIGTLPIYAMKSPENKFMLLVLKNPKEPLFMIDASKKVNWVLSQGVYATYTDQSNRSVLLRFRNHDELLAFSLIALSSTASATPANVTIIEEGPKASQIEISENSLIVDAKIVNFNDPTYNPMTNDGITIPRDYPSELRNIYNGGKYDSFCIISMNGNVFALCYVKPNPNQVATPEEPKIEEKPQEIEKKEEKTAQNTEKVETKPKQKEEKPKKKHEKSSEKEEKPKSTPTPAPQPKEEKLTPKETKTEEKPQQNQENVSKPPSTTVIVSQEEEPKNTPKPVFDAQLEQIRSEMTQKFNNLSKMIISLKQQQQQRSSAPLSSDILVASVQRLIRENREKDKLIAEKQQLIELLNARKSDTRERDELRRQLADLTSKVAAKKEETQKKLDEQRRLKDKVEVLKQKIAAARVDSESKLAAVRRELEAERQKQLSDLDQTKQHLQWSVNKAEAEVQELKKKIQEAEAENKRLKERTKVDSAKELENLKAKANELLEITVRKMVTGVFQNVQKAFQESQEYDGSQVIRGVRQLLQNQADEIFQEIDGDE